jgi:tetratricopeptide (TPR) repeat protein
MDRKEEALVAFNAALNREPRSTTVRAHLAMVHLLLGENAQSQSLISEIDTQGDHDLANWLSANQAFLKNEAGLAQRLADKLISSPSDYWKSQGFLVKARFLAELGQHTAAVNTLVDGIEFDRSHGRTTDESDKHLALAYLAYRIGDTHSCREHALAALDLDHASRQVSEAGTLLAHIGDIPSVNRLNIALDAQPGFYRVRLAKVRLSLEMDVARGDRRKAIDRVKTASVLARPNEALPYLAYARLHLGLTSEARSDFEHIVEAPGRLLFYPDNNLPGLWGDTLFDLLTRVPLPQNDRCRHFRQFLTLRQNADPVIMNREVRVLLSAQRTCIQ